MGRKYAVLMNDQTYNFVAGLAAIHCTVADAASALKIAERTFYKYLEENEDFKDAWEMGRGEGNVSLRRRQYEVAMSGNPAMLKWLGQNNLGQRDKSERDETRTHVLEVRKRAQEDAIAAVNNILKQLEHAKVSSIDVVPLKNKS